MNPITAWKVSLVEVSSAINADFKKAFLLHQESYFLHFCHDKTYTLVHPKQ